MKSLVMSLFTRWAVVFSSQVKVFCFCFCFCFPSAFVVVVLDASKPRGPFAGDWKKEKAYQKWWLREGSIVDRSLTDFRKHQKVYFTLLC